MNDRSVFVSALLILARIEIMSIGCIVEVLFNRWPRCIPRFRLVILTEGPPYSCWHPGFIQAPAIDRFPVMNVDDVALPLERLASLSRPAQMEAKAFV